MKRIIILFMGCCILTCQAQPARTQPAQAQPTRLQSAAGQPAAVQPAQTPSSQPQSAQPAQTQPATAQNPNVQPAQPVDSSTQLATSYFNEAAAAGRDQHIWKAPLYGHMLFVAPGSRVTYANMPDSAGILKPEGSIYKGVLPKDVILANTAIDWQGERWSVILWPLPPNRGERINLMMHESFHRIQEQLGLPERSPTADHLSSMYGRIYYLLELHALKAALQKPVGQRTADLTNALIFRGERQSLFPNTFNNERILEMSEGLAEYTGIMLGRQKDSILPHLYQQIEVKVSATMAG